MDNQILQRKGTFELPFASKPEEYELYSQILTNMVIVRAEAMFINNVIRYDAIHPMFDVVDFNQITPFYEIEVMTDDSGNITKINFIKRED